MRRDMECNANVRIAVPDRGFIFVETPKVACSSIKLAIGNSVVGARTEAQSRAWWQPKMRVTQEQVAKSDMFRFAVVRNPFDRLVSCWSDKVRAGHWDPPDNKRMTFPQLVHKLHEFNVIGNRHAAPMTQLLTYEGQLIIDYVLRFERLAEDWERLRALTGLGPLPHRNRSKHKPYQEYYDEELRYIVYGAYWQDLVNFGYNFDGTYTDDVPWIVR